MKISELVKGETIKIDNHNSGQKVGIDDQGLHLHKHYNHKSRYGGMVDVLIPINSAEIQVREKVGVDSDIILREIRKAFSDKKKRDEFITDIKEELSNLASAGRIGEDGKRILDEEGRKKVNQAIINVARQFGMGEECVKGNLYETDDSITKKFKSPINYETGRRNFPEVLYVRANITDISFLVTSARYMLEDVNR